MNALPVFNENGVLDDPIFSSFAFAFESVFPSIKLFFRVNLGWVRLPVGMD